MLLFLPHITITAVLCFKDGYLHEKCKAYILGVKSTKKGVSLQGKILATTLILRGQGILIFDPSTGTFNVNEGVVLDWVKSIPSMKPAGYRDFCTTVLLTLPPEIFSNKEVAGVVDRVHGILADACARYAEETQERKKKESGTGTGTGTGD